MGLQNTPKKLMRKDSNLSLFLGIIVSPSSPCGLKEVGGVGVLQAGGVLAAILGFPENNPDTIVRRVKATMSRDASRAILVTVALLDAVMRLIPRVVPAELQLLLAEGLGKARLDILSDLLSHGAIGGVDHVGHGNVPMAFCHDPDLEFIPEKGEKRLL